MSVMPSSAPSNPTSPDDMAKEAWFIYGWKDDTSFQPVFVEGRVAMLDKVRQRIGDIRGKQAVLLTEGAPVKFGERFEFTSAAESALSTWAEVYRVVGKHDPEY